MWVLDWCITSAQVLIHIGPCHRTLEHSTVPPSGPSDSSQCLITASPGFTSFKRSSRLFELGPGSDSAISLWTSHTSAGDH